MHMKSHIASSAFADLALSQFVHNNYTPPPTFVNNFHVKLIYNLHRIQFCSQFICSRQILITQAISAEIKKDVRSFSRP